VVQGDYTFDDGFRGARRLLALRDPPTAIFGSNDEIAAGVLAAAKSAGMNVPYDLSIAGFEDSPFSRQSWPPLTTAKQATEDIARHAARLLIGSCASDAYDERRRAAQPGLRAAAGGARLDRADAPGRRIPLPTILPMSRHVAARRKPP
jgi:LacI family transcriptional regulator